MRLRCSTLLILSYSPLPFAGKKYGSAVCESTEHRGTPDWMQEGTGWGSAWCLHWLPVLARGWSPGNTSGIQLIFTRVEGLHVLPQWLIYHFISIFKSVFILLIFQSIFHLYYCLILQIAVVRCKHDQKHIL